MLNRDLVSFYSDTPGTFSVIGDSGANLIPCVDFLNGRFGTLYALDYSANALVTYVTTSAARTVVGSAIPEAGHAWTGLAGDPDGTLYASSTDGSASRLYRINPATGAATLVGDIANGPVVIAIAVNALGEMYAHEIANDVLLRVDKATGAGTVLGSTGFDANYAQGMDFDDVNNVLYLAAYNNGVGRGELRVADLATGNTALIGPFASDVELCMAVAAGGPVPWVTLVPGEGTVAVNGSTNFSVVFDTAPLPNRALTNFADVRFDGTFVNAVTNLSLTLAVIPDDLTVAPADRRATTGLEGGPFAPISFVFAVTNRGASSIGWTVSDDAAWLNTLSAGGTLAAGAGTPVTTVVNAVAAGLPIGSYTADVAFVNSASGVAQHRFVDLQVRPPAPDYFTELFAGTGADTNDLDFLMLTLRPDGSSSHYSACLQRISQYPTDPVGGTVLTLADDAFVPVNLTGNVRVRLYGIAYSNLFVGSNGYITFGRGTNVWVESFAAHFALPRVAGLFDDLDPSARGQVSWRQLPDRIAVTWDNVPEFGVTSTNQFQITMHTNGMIRIAWLRITANDGLAGLSAGLGQPGDFGESDLSAYEPCSVQIAASVTGRGRIAPSGTVTVVTGGNTDFLVNADTYYHVADVRTNAGTVGGGLGPGTLQFGFVWSNITENGTVVGYVGETVTTNTGTPYWWLAQYGFTNNFEVAATNDADGDGVPTGDEYPSDMDPTNRASWFAVRAVSNLPPLRVFFPSSSNRQYTLEYRTNLSAGAWQAMPGQSNLTGADGLWFLSDTNNPAPPRFFRIRAGTK
jgi:hypothetical protein